MTDSSDRNVSLPPDLTASMEAIWRSERGGLPEEETAETEPVAAEDRAVLERIAGRPRIEQCYRWAMEQRDKNRPIVVRSWFSGATIEHAEGQSPAKYAQGLRCAELIATFSEVAEARLEENVLRPEHAIAATLEELIKEKCRKVIGLDELKRQITMLCELSQWYREDCT